ncbi:MAG: [Fe-Fe] hydrogenase large subunit C-terminal domain-containing protein [Spirochaetia bacterium]
MLDRENNQTYLRREIYRSVLLARKDTQGGTQLNRIPSYLHPSKGEPNSCCVFHDRIITRKKVLSAMGVHPDKDDEDYPIAFLAAPQYRTSGLPEQKIAVITDACSGCKSAGVEVTSGCRGCAARPCLRGCPKGAVYFKNGKSHIDEEKCVNCGKCISLCPFSAIVKVSAPCESVCPVGAIKKQGGNEAVIDEQACTECGLCARACPFGAITEISQLWDLKNELEAKNPVVALLAPSAAGQLPGSKTQLASALNQAGFIAVFDVGKSADETAGHEALELSEAMEEGTGCMASSCCPAWVAAAKQKLAQFSEQISSTPSPMVFARESAKKLFPGAVLCFIGPCTAKTAEARDIGGIDYVITFEELGALLLSENIMVEDCKEGEFADGKAEPLGAGFAASGGVAKAIAEAVKPAEVQKIDGLDRKAFAGIKAYLSGKMNADFLEVMNCPGGCIAGPGVVAHPRIAKRRLEAEQREKTAV